MERRVIYISLQLAPAQRGHTSPPASSGPRGLKVGAVDLPIPRAVPQAFCDRRTRCERVDFHLRAGSRSPSGSCRWIDTTGPPVTAGMRGLGVAHVAEASTELFALCGSIQGHAHQTAEEDGNRVCGMCACLRNTSLSSLGEAFSITASVSQ